MEASDIYGRQPLHRRFTTRAVCEAGLHVYCAQVQYMYTYTRINIISKSISILHAETAGIAVCIFIDFLPEFGISYIYTIMLVITSSLLNHLLASSSITALQSSTVLTNSGTSLKQLSTATGESLELLPREADTVTQPSTHTEHTYEELADVVAPTISTADRRTDSE